MRGVHRVGFVVDVSRRQPMILVRANGADGGPPRMVLVNRHPRLEVDGVPPDYCVAPRIANLGNLQTGLAPLARRTVPDEQSHLGSAVKLLLSRAVRPR